MRSAIITHSRLLCILLYFSPYLLLGQASSDYSCIGDAKVKVDGSCQYILDPNEFLTGGPALENLKVFVFDSNPSNREIVECPGTYNYSITNERNVIICWGVIELQDTIAPVPVDTITTFTTLECAQIDKILNNPLTIEPTINGLANPYYLGEIVFQENCSSCNCELTRKFFDQVDFFACDSLPYFARITRIWSASDCNDLISQATQYFDLYRPDFQELVPVEDQRFSTCSPDTITVPVSYPYWIDTFGDTLYVNQLDCNLEVRTETIQSDNCSGNARSWVRYINVFDWCTGTNTTVDSFQIEIGDFSGPAFFGNAQTLDGTNILNGLNNFVLQDSIDHLSQAGLITEMSTGPMNCMSGFLTDIPSLQTQFNFYLEDCSSLQLNFALYSYDNNLAANSWRFSDFNPPPGTNPTSIINIPPGLHSLVIEATDDCGNASSAILFFIVQDKVTPNAKCIPAQTIALDYNSLIAGKPSTQIGIEDIDNGSFDNCALGLQLIRRPVNDLVACIDFWIQAGYDSNGDGDIDERDFIDLNNNQIQDPEEYNWTLEAGTWYTPWSIDLPVSCCDLDQSILVQLRLADQAIHPLTGQDIPNTSFCSSVVEVIDSNTPTLSSLADVALDCSDPVLLDLADGIYTLEANRAQLLRIRDRLGTASIENDGCGRSFLEEQITSNRDQCGFGEIIRTIRLKTNSNGVSTILESLTQTILIKERYDYWIKFPKDITANCSAGVVDSGQLEVVQQNCDLLAIGYQDEYFYAPQTPEACFKIFRTYQVINWCEYDGSSAPVVVSRDWDTWNGTSCSDQYNINPEFPDGNNIPGDQDLYVIVRRNFNDAIPDTVYYDADPNPNNTFPDNPETSNIQEAYWWKVISGPGTPETASYFEAPIICGDQSLPNVWGANIMENFNEPVQTSNTTQRYGSYGYWQYTQHLSILDNVFPVLDISGSSFICSDLNENCETEVQFIFKGEDQCAGSGSIEISVQYDPNKDGSNLLDYTEFLRDTLFTAFFPLGDHQLIINANDNCGNLVQQLFSFTVRDCNGPKPICESGRIVELMNEVEGNDANTIWAQDLVLSDVYDCSGQGPDQNADGQLIVKDYSINRLDDPVVRSQRNLKVDCNDVDEDLIVEIHAWDEYDQHDFCQTIISVRDLQAVCTAANGLIAGIVRTENADMVQNVDVQLSGSGQMLYLTDEAGYYAFEGVEPYGDYTVFPSLNSGFHNGISTLDIILIQKHILGQELLESPYQFIAADVNNSKSISTIDIIQLRKLILNIDIAFEHNSSWRFIAADYTFPNLTNPWQATFPEFISLNNLQDSLTNVDFIGVKIGDVSGNADPQGTRSLENRNGNEVVYLSYLETTLQAGRQYTIPIQAKLAKLQGMQFTLGVDPKMAELVDIQDAALQKNNLAWNSSNQLIAASWIKSDAPFEISAQDTTCFWLKIKAKVNTPLSKILTLNDRITSSEAYQDDQAVALSLIEISNTSQFPSGLEVKQNYPNPFNDLTNLTFQNPEAGLLKVQIIDANGRIIKSLEKFYTAGQHHLQFNKNDFNGPGIYFFKVSNGMMEQTIRMIYF